MRCSRFVNGRRLCAGRWNEHNRQPQMDGGEQPIDITARRPRRSRPSTHHLPWTTRTCADPLQLDVAGQETIRIYPPRDIHMIRQFVACDGSFSDLNSDRSKLKQDRAKGCASVGQYDGDEPGVRRLECVVCRCSSCYAHFLHVHDMARALATRPQDCKSTVRLMERTKLGQ